MKLEQDNLSVDAAAKRIGISPFTLRAWIRERRIPFYRAGRRIVIAPDDVEHFLASRRIPARQV